MLGRRSWLCPSSRCTQAPRAYPGSRWLHDRPGSPKRGLHCTPRCREGRGWSWQGSVRLPSQGDPMAQLATSTRLERIVSPHDIDHSRNHTLGVRAQTVMHWSHPDESVVDADSELHLPVHDVPVPVAGSMKCRRLRHCYSAVSARYPTRQGIPRSTGYRYALSAAAFAGIKNQPCGKMHVVLL